jgi:hypothetical protein
MITRATVKVAPTNKICPWSNSRGYSEYIFGSFPNLFDHG